MHKNLRRVRDCTLLFFTPSLSILQNNPLFKAKTLVSNVDSLDWKELTEEEMKNRIFDRIQPGSILLFHNGTPQTADALPGILSALKNEGYEFVKVSDLIYKENYTIDHTGRQFQS